MTTMILLYVLITCIITAVKLCDNTAPLSAIGYAVNSNDALKSAPFMYSYVTDIPIISTETLFLNKPVKVIADLDETELETGLQINDCTVGNVAGRYIPLTFWNNTCGEFDTINIPVGLYNRLLRAWGDPTEHAMTWYFEKSPRGNILVTEIVKVEYNIIHED